ncbi:hypothetical protein CJ030_MR2G001465 [Morella rubra]|uniref:Uncharacterized protein n=1 Tax=Morella rubra TaxID=262757 RepID=A0A6A1W929_9ROSI|nr:hypothetical protein CJ030_MR2G001465 [Morella rubra]
MEPKPRNALLFLLSLLFFLSTSSLTPLQYQTLVPNPLPNNQHTLSWPESEALLDSSKPDPNASSTTLQLHHIDFLSLNKTPEQHFNLKLQRDTLRVKTLTSLAAVRNESRTSAEFSSSVVSRLP